MNFLGFIAVRTEIRYGLKCLLNIPVKFNSLTGAATTVAVIKMLKTIIFRIVRAS